MSSVKLARQPSAALTRVLFATLLSLAVSSNMARAQDQDQDVPDTFTATTTGMSPDGLTLRIDVLEWSDADARAAVLAALTDRAESPKTASGPLTGLPTIGYVWPSESPVGYALKYAHRIGLSGDGEQVTFVTDRTLGSYRSESWVVGGDSAPPELGYSVIELYLDADGKGAGTMSVAADVELDQESGSVSLAEGGTKVLTGAKREPKPYWADDT